LAHLHRLGRFVAASADRARWPEIMSPHWKRLRAPARSKAHGQSNERYGLELGPRRGGAERLASDRLAAIACRLCTIGPVVLFVPESGAQ